MILILLGTQDKPFTRLLDAVEKQIKLGNIKEKVVVQAGHTKYESANMEIFDLISNDKYKKLIKEVDLVITHGGVSSITDSLKFNKKVIAVARKKEYGEHVNNHQQQIIDKFVEMKYLLKLDDFDKLDQKLIEIKKFKLKKYISTAGKVIDLIDKYIENI